MDLTEKMLETQIIYDGAVLLLRRDTVSIPGGGTSFREVVEHPGAVGIVPVDGEGNVYLVRQYRYPLKREALEIPAGKLEKGEDPMECARRELSEEVGAEAGKMTFLGKVDTSPGFCNEAIHLYLAQDLTFGAVHPDEDEFLEPETMKLDELVEQALDGRLTDGKTVVGALRAAALLRKGE